MQTPGRHVIIGQAHQLFSSLNPFLKHLHFQHMKFRRSSSRVLPQKEKLNTTSVFSPFSCLQSIHPVERRLVSLLHRHVLQPHG